MSNLTKKAESPAAQRRLLTVPNVLCLVRLVGAVGFFPLAVADRPVWVLVLYFALTATDWIDGKIARWLDQKSVWGPLLDSIADVAMYGGLFVAAVWLKGSTLAAQWPWIAAAVLTYAVSCLACLMKFQRLPSYHTRAAKLNWLLMIVAVPAVLLDWSVWPLRVAMAAIAIGNLEAAFITYLLPRWMEDVPSLASALRLRRTPPRDE